MNVVFAVIFIGGASAFALWSIIGLIGAIKDRKEKKRKAETPTDSDNAAVGDNDDPTINHK